MARLALVSLGAAPAAAQTVQGRVLELPDEAPVPGALIALVDTAGGEVTRGATSPSGGFVLSAGRAGRYHVLIRRIGQHPWRSPAFALAAGVTYPVTFRVDARPYELPTLMVEARRTRCGARPGTSDALGALLDAAEIALQLAKRTADERRLAFSTSTYLRALGPDLRMLDSASTGVTQLARWPIESADPDSLRAWGFVRQPSAAERATSAEQELGPTYYGPDARVLFSEWFLASHCFRVEEDAGLLDLRFAPERRGDRAGIQGRLLIDRASMELRRLEFEYVGLPRWVPKGKAGGFVELRRLREGAWVPRSWQLRAPQAVRSAGSSRLRLRGWLETGGRVTAVRTTVGQVDSVSTAELLREREAR
ncbi:MAG TPA: carboxypeptidase-like regulatory domain-containing protein [Gemmatimonadales bacterium]